MASRNKLPKSSGLVRLFELTDATHSVWRPDDLGGVLRHQLRAPLVINLQRLGADDAAGQEPQVPPLDRLLDVIHHPAPPLVVLRMVKEFAKLSRREVDGPLPKEVASVLYYAMILLARLRHGVRLTRLSDAQLATATRWALDREWLDPAIRSVFREAAAIGSGGE